MEANVILEPGYVLLKPIEEVEESKLHLTGEEGKKYLIEKQQEKLRNGSLVIGSNCTTPRLGTKVRCQDGALIINHVPLKGGGSTSAWFVHESQIMFTFVD